MSLQTLCCLKSTTLRFFDGLFLPKYFWSRSLFPLSPFSLVDSWDIGSALTRWASCSLQLVFSIKASTVDVCIASRQINIMSEVSSEKRAKSFINWEVAILGRSLLKRLFTDIFIERKMRTRSRSYNKYTGKTQYSSKKDYLCYPHSTCKTRFGILHSLHRRVEKQSLCLTSCWKQ